MQSVTRADVPNPGCADIKEILEACKLAAGRLPFEIVRNKAVAVTVADWHIDPATGNHSLLVNKADITKSDVAFRDLQTFNVRKAGKQRTEAIESSSHLIIQPAAGGRTAKVLMTMGAGLGAVVLERLMTVLSRLAKKHARSAHLFQFPVPSGERDAKGVPVTYGVRYSFECAGYKGLVLDNALRTGEFLEMELIAHDMKAFDAGGNLAIEQQSIKVRPAGAGLITGPKLRQMLKGFMASKGHDPYDQARIRYKTPAGKTSTTTLEMNALDAAFTQSELIHLDPPADEHQIKLHPGILAEMKKLL
jgi:hypothetical protein